VNEHTADKAKRRKTRELIEQELYTYEQSRREIERRIAEIDDIASPRSNWPPVGKASSEKGDVVAFVEGRSEGQTSDPTAERAQKVWNYRKGVLSSRAYLEMAKRVEAIEKVLDRWDEAAACGDTVAGLKLTIVRRKYFKRLSDETIWEQLRIGRTTFYRYRRVVLEEIAQELGWVV
jgi:hypothetical protein